MNHDSTSRSPADPPANDNSDDGNRHRSNTESHAEPSGSGNENGSAQKPSLSKKTKEGLKQKLLFMTHLVTSLDTLVYAELCVLYYMDCSFFRLLIRWISQWLFLSPKPEDFLLIIPKQHVGAIIGPNLICMILHLITTIPTAGEATRGYLHGGVLVDFIGQKAPTSKLSLLLLDALIFALQCIMLSVNLQKERLKRIVKPPRQGTGDGAVTSANGEQNGNSETPRDVTGQDHDAEERGVLRDAPTLDENGGIELQTITGTGGREGGERDHLLGSTSGITATSTDLPDLLRSGNAILADFHVLHALRTMWNEREATAENAAAYALQNMGYNATLAALAAQRRARLAAAQRR